MTNKPATTLVLHDSGTQQWDINCLLKFLQQIVSKAIKQFVKLVHDVNQTGRVNKSFDEKISLERVINQESV